MRKRRSREIGKVIDLGAGDGRFARYGAYSSCVGYEINADRCSGEGMDLRDHVVSYSTGFYKVEINQVNSLLAKLTTGGDG